MNILFRQEFLVYLWINHLGELSKTVIIFEDSEIGCCYCRDALLFLLVLQHPQ